MFGVSTVNNEADKKIVEVPGFEPGAFRMQSECDTTTPHPQTYQFTSKPFTNTAWLATCANSPLSAPISTTIMSHLEKITFAKIEI